MKPEDYPKIYLYRRIVQAKLYIDNNYTGNIDLDGIAGEACFSKFHFTRLFKRTYGKTPHQYLITVRIGKAMQLLNDNMPVSEACLAVGFESISSFSGLFKRVTGITPSVYLQQRQAHKAQVMLEPLRFVPACFASQHGWLKNSNFEEAEV